MIDHPKQKPNHSPVTPATPPLRIAVIGGGLCGLAAAHRCEELSYGEPDRGDPGKHSSPACEISLFEAGNRWGGLVQTQRIAGYLVELGADSFITNKPAAIQLCRRLGLEPELIPTNGEYRKSLVLHRGRPSPVPEGFQLLTPASIGSIIRSPLFSWRGKLRMACEPFIPRRSTGGDESLASFVRRRFGQEALERLVQPMVGGIYTSDPERLSLQATMPRFLEMEQKQGSLLRAMALQNNSAENQAESSSGARYGLFTTLRNGLSDLVNRLTERLQAAGVQLHTGSKVKSLHRPPGSEGYEVELENGELSRFDAVILTLPVHHAAQLLEPLHREIADSLRSIEYASSAIVVSGHNLSDVKDRLDAFGLVIPAIEQRRILAVSFSSRKFPGRAPDGKVLLRTFVGGAMQSEEFERSDNDVLNLVQQELKELLGVRGTPDFMQVCRYPRAMPQYHVGHLERVQTLQAMMKNLPGLFLAGNAYEGVGIPDTIGSGERAAEQLFRSVSR